MSTPKMLRQALTALALTGGMVLAAAPATQAVTSVDVTCESGAGQFFCAVTHDGVAPVTIKWTINGAYDPSRDNRVTTGRRACGTSAPTVYAVVSDASGAKTGLTTFSCNYGPWP